MILLKFEAYNGPFNQHHIMDCGIFLLIKWKWSLWICVSDTIVITVLFDNFLIQPFSENRWSDYSLTTHHQDIPTQIFRAYPNGPCLLSTSLFLAFTEIWFMLSVVNVTKSFACKIFMQKGPLISQYFYQNTNYTDLLLRLSVKLNHDHFILLCKCID